MKTIYTIETFTGFSIDNLTYNSVSVCTTLNNAKKAIEDYKTKFNLVFIEKKQEINMTFIYKHPETGCYYKFVISAHTANVLFS